MQGRTSEHFWGWLEKKSAKRNFAIRVMTYSAENSADHPVQSSSQFMFHIEDTAKRSQIWRVTWLTSRGVPHCKGYGAAEVEPREQKGLKKNSAFCITPNKVWLAGRGPIPLWMLLLVCCDRISQFKLATKPRLIAPHSMFWRLGFRLPCNVMLVWSEVRGAVERQHGNWISCTSTQTTSKTGRSAGRNTKVGTRPHR
jgi:hypothetical protein